MVMRYVHYNYVEHRICRRTFADVLAELVLLRPSYLAM